MNKTFWKDKRVFITGHTGFKGSWLSIWLDLLGAKVSGFALAPSTNPNLFQLAEIDRLTDSFEGDIRNKDLLLKTMQQCKPEIVIHMAAQPLVRQSYINPVDTYETNVMGTVNLLDAIRNTSSVRAFVNVTTDKVYENKEWEWGYRENEPVGGYDPYSNSKACSELVTAAYRNSFFNLKDYSKHNVAIATARAGNVIGGGDWAIDRIVPDCIRALTAGELIMIRNPHAVRPWQHVLEPLGGYLLLAEKLYTQGQDFAESWNFGPDDYDCVSVQTLVHKLCDIWGDGAKYHIVGDTGPHEANYLKLDCSKAKSKMGWSCNWRLEEALQAIVSWTKGFLSSENVRELCIEQIRNFSCL